MPLKMVATFAMQDMDSAAPVSSAMAHTDLGSAARMGQHAEGPQSDTPSHRLWRKPNLTSARHPFRSIVQRRVHQNTVVCPPSASNLRHTILEDSHPRPHESAQDRLHQSRTQIQASNTGNPVEGRQEVTGILNHLRFNQLLAGLRVNSSTFEGDRQRRKRDVEVRTITHRNMDASKTMCRHRQRVNPFGANRIEPTFSIGRKCGTTWPSLDQGLTAWRMAYGVENMTVDRAGSLSEQHTIAC